jgi:uncharacterized protein YlxW (UPF0749 family)
VSLSGKRSARPRLQRSADASARPRGGSEDLLADLFRTPLDSGYAQAARRRAGQPRPAGWRILGGRGALAIALAAIGFLFAVAYHHAMAAAPGTTKARADLVTDVRARRQQADELQRQAEQLRDEVAKARDNALAGGGDAARLRDLAAGTGLIKVTGDGVVVRVADAPPPIDPVTGKQSVDNPGIVLDRDLQDIANGLWQAGAEAVAVNGQRLAATSTIRTAGGAILVDFRPVTSPYEVSAIGPSDITDAFNGSATAKRFHRFVDTYRMQFSVKSRGGLTLPAAPDPRLLYAHPPAPSPSASSPNTSSPSTGGR